MGVALALILALNVAAQATDYLIPVGRAVGIEIQCDGVLVVQTTEVETSQGKRAPAEQAGIMAGDVIMEMDGQGDLSNEKLQKLVADSGGREMTVSVRRGGQTLSLSAKAALSREKGIYQLGVLVRDSMAGIGTITYVDPESGRYGSLGHAIADADSGNIFPLKSGSLIEAMVANVQKGQSGAPGSLQGVFDASQQLGTVEKNTGQGIFGVAESSLYQGKTTVAVASPEQIHVGEAQILSNVEDDRVEAYAVEIVKVYGEKAQDNHDLMLRITDSLLLGKTGGIVQGMSGSPILQDGRLVGAVTHVLVNDPTRGYGILLDHMAQADEPSQSG